MLELTEKDDNCVILVEKEEVINITLAWKPTSGFLWQQADGEAGLLVKIEHPGENGKLGAASFVKFYFKIVSAGVINLDYARPWEETTPPLKWFTVNVTLKN